MLHAHEAYKPYKALIALFAALSLCLFAACSSDDDTPAYCGKWTPTDALITHLNSALSTAGSTSVSLTTDTLSLTINSNNTVSIIVLGGMITIPGNYTYSGSDSSGTFSFTLDYTSLGDLAQMARAIGSTFTEKDITYTTGSLFAVLGTANEATKIFTK